MSRDSALHPTFIVFFSKSYHRDLAWKAAAYFVLVFGIIRRRNLLRVENNASLVRFFKSRPSQNMGIHPTCQHANGREGVRGSAL